ncbi:MAG TPA: hypothetical protein DCY13_14750, partial [Verrucomicrobiales bacterium]|nr:hypothetical protein [Verrucomicrobiales bacterium]
SAACTSYRFPKLVIERTENGAASHLKLALATDSWLAVHPGSGSERKNWPLESWRRFLRRLLGDTGWRLLIVGGETEGDRLDQLAAELPTGRVAVARSLPLTDLAQLLPMTRGFIGHDSGISHLAAAVDTPCLLLWGETNPQVWRPPSLKVELLQHPGGLAAIEPDAVLGWCVERWG